MSTNETIAAQLEDIANLLERQDANRFRVQAYRDAAITLRRLQNDAEELYRNDGTEALEDLPNVGRSIAGAIGEFLDTGSIGLLRRLRGEADPVAELAALPGVGETLARRAHEELGIESLEELETAAYDGSLAEVEGFGATRIEGLKDVLDTRLRRRGRRREEPDEAGAPPASGAPSVEELLDVDREYREKADAGKLRTIAPRRFNPEGEAWLPILHTERDDREYTALYSNTARAHELGKTGDWVVIYLDDEDRQYTVVTAQRGDLAGRRVVRGREDEVRDHVERDEG